MRLDFVPTGSYIAFLTGPQGSHDHPERMGQEITPMKREFKIGDHVEWNSEAGHVRGTIKKRVISAIKFKTYTVRASKEEPQYLIKSDKTDHMAMHKGAALTKIGKADARLRRIEPEEEMKHKKTCRRRNSSRASTN